jgi:hypothetical protein
MEDKKHRTSLMQEISGTTGHSGGTRPTSKSIQGGSAPHNQLMNKSGQSTGKATASNKFSKGNLKDVGMSIISGGKAAPTKGGMPLPGADKLQP